MPAMTSSLGAELSDGYARVDELDIKIATINSLISSLNFVIGTQSFSMYLSSITTIGHFCALERIYKNSFCIRWLFSQRW